MTRLKSKVITGLAWSSIAKFISQLLSWVATFVVIRYLNPSDYATVGIVFAFTAFFYVLSEFGLADALIQKETVTEENYSQVFSATLALNSVIFLFITVLSTPFANFYQNEALASVLVFTAANLLLSSFIVVPEALMNKAMLFKKRAFIETAANTLNTITTLGLAVIGFGFWSILIGLVINTLSRVVLLNYFGYHHYKITFNFSGFASLLNFGGYTFASRAVWALYNKLDILIIGRVFGAQSLGIYTVATQLASMPLDKISGTINQVAFSAFSQNSDNEKHFLLSLRLLSITIFPAFIGIAAISPILVPILIGDKWLESIVIIQLLSLIMPLKLINSFINTFIASQGDAKFNLKMSLLYLGFVTIGLLMGSYFDFVGTVIGLVISYACCFLIVSFISLTKTSCKITSFLDCLLRPILCSLSMWLFIWVFTNQLPVTIPPIINLLIMMLFGVTTYIILALVFARTHLKDVLDLCRQVKS